MSLVLTTYFAVSTQNSYCVEVDQRVCGGACAAVGSAESSHPRIAKNIRRLPSRPVRRGQLSTDNQPKPA